MVVQRGVLQMLKDIQAESGNTVLLVTHDMAVHANVADRVVIMYAGRIVEEAPTADDLQRAAAPVHAAPDPLAADDRRQVEQGQPRRRAAEPGQPAERLPLPPALPARDGHLPD